MAAKLKPIKLKNGTILKFDKTLIMGILNVTPDSFSDGGKFFDSDKITRHEKAVARALEMESQGAGIIDIGGKSTRPGSAEISVEEEMERVIPIIENLSKKLKIPISIDSYKPEVVEAALKAGAAIVNDVNGLRNMEIAKIAAKHKAPVVIMHMQGTPRTMQENPHYRNVVKEIREFFAKQIKVAKKAGVKDIMIDPGIGFGKKLEHNLEIFRNLDKFKSLKCPIVVGASRKSFIGMVSGLAVGERLEGSLAAAAISAFNGANILRVHDVKETKRVLEIVDAIKGNK